MTYRIIIAISDGSFFSLKSFWVTLWLHANHQRERKIILLVTLFPRFVSNHQSMRKISRLELADFISNNRMLFIDFLHEVLRDCFHVPISCSYCLRTPCWLKIIWNKHKQIIVVIQHNFYAWEGLRAPEHAKRTVWGNCETRVDERMKNKRFQTV